MPGPAAGSRGVARLEIVARASDNGAFAMKDMCMQRTWAALGGGIGAQGSNGEGVGKVVRKRERGK